jgi:DNA-binding transcriptional ArsR family regulator
MDEKTKRQFEARAKILKAMAHPSRLCMLHELSGGERCVCELQEVVEADMSTVSKHLTVLREAGLVLNEKRGLQVYYRLRVPCVMNFFDCVEAVLKRNAEDQAALVE